MDLKNQIELELYFADHFDTILFPVLADIYFRQEDYRRARKVCNIGLGYHENDPEGRFLLAKVEKAEGNLKESERELEHSLKYHFPYLYILNLNRYPMKRSLLNLGQFQQIFYLQLCHQCQISEFALYLNPS